MKKLILNPKNKKGIIAELIGENGIRIQKRRSDNFPINIFIKGLDYTVVANCTLTGDPVLIECIDGKIQIEDLVIEERKDENDNEEKPEDKGGEDNGAGDDNGADNTGAGKAGDNTGDDAGAGAKDGDDANGGEAKS